MKILQLCGSYQNTGDHLIVERSEALLKKGLPGCQIERMMYNEDWAAKLDYINSFDLIVFGGGPAYREAFSRENLLLTFDLSNITPKMAALGLGWYGENSDADTVYSYKFNEMTLQLFKRIESDAGYLGCRDNYSVRILRNMAFENPIMTGCPAWYDLAKIDEAVLRDGIDYSFKKINVSDPGKMKKNGQRCVSLLRYLKKRFPNSEITLFFHKGIKGVGAGNQKYLTPSAEVAAEARRLGVQCRDVSGKTDGLSGYDDGDLHIGFRVHAHIYNLSQRNASILIEEDGRGAGVNEALGLMRISVFDTDRAAFRRMQFGDDYNRIALLADKYFPPATKLMPPYKKLLTGDREPHLLMIREIDDYLYLLEKSNYQTFSTAFERMRMYYETMLRQIRSLA